MYILSNPRVAAHLRKLAAVARIRFDARGKTVRNTGLHWNYTGTTLLATLYSYH